MARLYTYFDDNINIGVSIELPDGMPVEQFLYMIDELGPLLFDPHDDLDTPEPTQEPVISPILDKEKYNAIHNSVYNDTTCPVCCYDYEGDDCVSILPCSHFFHYDCIAQWSKINPTCPVCRYAVPYEHSQSVETEYRDDYSIDSF